MTRIIWFIIGGSSLGLGTLGIFLPLLPTVPFYLLAALAFSKSSDKIHNWLLNHRIFGADIRNWNENRVIKRRAKTMAIASMFASVMLALFLAVPYKYIAIQVVILSVVARFIWRQNER